MSQETLVITITAADRPGVVQSLSDTALKHQANWLDSSLSHLCGQFAGIVRLEVASANKQKLVAALSQLAEAGIMVTTHEPTTSTTAEPTETVELYLEANDRPGIVEEITTALATTLANVEQLETWRESASMAGYELFIAQLMVSLPAGYNSNDLEAVLEGISDDLMVSIVDD